MEKMERTNACDLFKIFLFLKNVTRLYLEQIKLFRKISNGYVIIPNLRH